MELNYQRATLADLELLTNLRLTVLRAANQLDESVDLRQVWQNTQAYYEAALRNNSHIAYLVYDGTALVGAGGVSFYQILPTYHNQTGEHAYIMNMYTEPAYRSRGIATQLLHLLVSDAKRRGVTRITLDSTPMGRPLDDHFGCGPMPAEMELPHQT